MLEIQSTNCWCGEWVLINEKSDINGNIKYIILVIINRYLLWLCLYMELSILSFKKYMMWQNYNRGFKYRMDLN